MSADDALEQLQRGNSVSCMTPNGTKFRIESKLSYGIAWYRSRPVRRGCLNRFSRLTDSQMLEWLNNVTIVSAST